MLDRDLTLALLLLAPGLLVIGGGLAVFVWIWAQLDAAADHAHRLLDARLDAED